jgi:hypothetical protein
MKRIFSTLVAIASLAFASVAAASPAAYVNTPLDTVQATVNAAIANINAASPALAVNQTGTSSSNAVTINGVRGTITTEALTTAAAATFTETLTNSSITAASQVFVTVGLGTSSTGVPVLTTVTPAAGSVVIIIQNNHASAAFNGTLKISFQVVN